MVNTGAPTPLWQQVIALIRRNIDEGTWPANHQIPSERELCDTYAISRTTVRLAINQAVNEGLLTRIHGKGTFVAPPKVRQPLFQITGFEATLQTLGLEPGTELVDIRQQPADVPTAHLLRLAPGSEVARVRVLGLGSGEPMAVYTSVVPGDLARPLRAEVNRRQESGRTFFVGEVLAELNGWAYVNADQTYEVALAEGEVIRLLRLTRRLPVFRVTSLFQNPDGVPVEYRQTVYRGDKYQFHVTRQMYFSGKGETR